MGTAVLGASSWNLPGGVGSLGSEKKVVSINLAWLLVLLPLGLVLYSLLTLRLKKR